MGISSSPNALTFARAVIQDRKIQADKLCQKAQPETVDGLSKPVKDNPLRRICDIDYGKWETLADTLTKDEEREQMKHETDAADFRRAMAGCAHDHSQERQIFEKSTEEKLRAAERFRNEGNIAYKEKNYGLAAVNYRKALLQFDYTFPDTVEETERYHREKLASHLNMAACKLKQQDWEETLTQCRLALEIDPNNCKAFYRRGLVYMSLDYFEDAQKAFDSAKQIEPGDGAILGALSHLHVKRVKYNKKKKLVYASMFHATGKDESLSDNPNLATVNPQPCTSSTNLSIPVVPIEDSMKILNVPFSSPPNSSDHLDHTLSAHQIIQSGIAKDIFIPSEKEEDTICHDKNTISKPDIVTTDERLNGNLQHNELISPNNKPDTISPITPLKNIGDVKPYETDNEALTSCKDEKIKGQYEDNNSNTEDSTILLSHTKHVKNDLSLNMVQQDSLNCSYELSSLNPKIIQQNVSKIKTNQDNYISSQLSDSVPPSTESTTQSPPSTEILFKSTLEETLPIMMNRRQEDNTIHSRPLIPLCVSFLVLMSILNFLFILSLGLSIVYGDVSPGFSGYSTSQITGMSTCNQSLSNRPHLTSQIVNKNNQSVIDFSQKLKKSINSNVCHASTNIYDSTLFTSNEANLELPIEIWIPFDWKLAIQIFSILVIALQFLCLGIMCISEFVCYADTDTKEQQCKSSFKTMVYNRGKKKTLKQRNHSTVPYTSSYKLNKSQQNSHGRYYKLASSLSSSVSCVSSSASALSDEQDCFSSESVQSL